MGERQKTTFPLQGIDLVTTGHGTQLGDCRLLENLVPTGRPDQRLWEVPKGTSVPTDAGGNAVTGILSLGWQRRQKIGDAADLKSDPDQSAQRLIALKEDGLYTVDPGNEYNQKRIYKFDGASSSRRATFQQIGDSLFVSVVGSPGGDVTHFLEVTGDEVGSVEWPSLPRLSVTPEPLGNEEGLPRGPVSFRVAYELEDGTIGPTSTYLRANNVGVGGQTWEARFTVDRGPQYGTRWQNRIQNLVVIAHPPSRRSHENPSYNRPRISTQPESNPGRIVQRRSSFELRDSWRLRMTEEDVVASPVYDGIGLRAHQVLAGAPYAYNSRLLCGDARYDLARPSIPRQFVYDGGYRLSGGTYYHMLLQVTIRTQAGDVVRLSVPRPFEPAEAEQVELQHGHLTYPDERAKTYDIFVSDNYSGDIGEADWWRPTMIGMSRTFDTVEGSGLSYDDVRAGQPYDLTTTINNNPIDVFKALRFEQSTTSPQDFVSGPGAVGDDYRLDRAAKVQTSGVDESEDDAVTEVVTLGTLYGDDDYELVSLELDFYHRANVGPNNDADGQASTELVVEVRDDAGTVLAGQTETLSQSGSGSVQDSGRITLSSYTAANAHDVRLKLSVQATASDGGSGFADAGGEVRLNNSWWNIDGSAGDGDPDTPKENDVNPSRIIFSEPNRPLDFPPENVVYAGNEPSDAVLALRATGQEVSEGQFGTYPILCFQERSVRALQVGTDRFIEGVDVLAAGEGQGLVGRRAVTVAKSRVVAVLRAGVCAFSPQQEMPALSAPIHDPAEDVLSSMGPDTALSHYEDQGRFREELWVHAQALTWCYSISQGGWSTLTRRRRDSALWRGQYAVRPDGASGGTLVREEQDEDAELDVRVQTALIEPGPLGTLGRMKQVHLRQPLSLTEAELVLVAADPKAEYVQLGSALLTGSSYNAGLPLRYGLAPGYVVDIRAIGAPGQLIEAVMLGWDARDRTLRDHLDHGIPAYDRQSEEKTQTELALTSSSTA